MLMEDYITEVYCLIDDMLKKAEKITEVAVRSQSFLMRR